MIATIVLAGYRRMSLLLPALAWLWPAPLTAAGRWLRSRRRVPFRQRLWACVMPRWVKNG